MTIELTIGQLLSEHALAALCGICIGVVIGCIVSAKYSESEGEH